MFRKFFTQQEWRVLSALRSPQKIQDFLNCLPMNVESEGDTCLSPRRVLREHRAHCIEGAMLAALALRAHGHPPLLVDLMASRHDDDHVIAVFRQRGCWGALSKTNHASLRYREPVYVSIRELVMSYFHEYFTQRNGKKTLRSYSQPINLSRFDHQGWMTAEEDVWYVPEYLCEVRHTPILTRAQIRALRRVDWIELQAGETVEWGRNQ